MPAPPAAVLAAAALLGGAAAGVGLERAGVLSPLDEPTAADVRSDVVDVLDCPDGTLVASLTRGDRILATGRSEDGDWIEIRSPLGLDERVWLPTATVAPDGDRSALDGLPERECELERPTTTTSSTSTTSTTSTTVPTTTTEPPPASTTTTRPPRTTTTTATTIPPDTTPPVLGTIQRSNVVIKDSGGKCPGAGGPTTSVISVSVTDDRPGVTVSMTYAFTGLQGPLSGDLNNPTQQGSTFSATFGPFPPDTAPNSGPVIATITVIASDVAGNQAQGQTTVEIGPCPA